METTGTRDVEHLERQLLDLVAEHFANGRDGLCADSRLADFGVDSMATLQLLVMIEKRFGLWLPDDDVSSENLETIRTLARTLERRLAERSPA